MAYDEALKKKEDCIVGESGIEEVGLAAGRSQREKKRSYKDLLREEEEIDAEVRKSAKKKAKESEGFLLGADFHKKKKKLQHLTGEEFYYGELSPMEPVKKKKKSESHQPDTAMGLLKAITSPIPAVAKPSKKVEKAFSAFSSPSYPPFHTESKKDHKKKASSVEHEEASEEGELHKSKKMKPLFVNTDTVTVREGEGLKMKLLLSPKDKSGTDDEPFNFAGTSSLKKSSKKLSREEHGPFLSALEAHGMPKASVVRKKHKSDSRLGESFDSEAHFYTEVHAGNLSEYEFSGLEALDTASSSGGELEAGELVIDDSFREMKKKKKKDKKSKKKKDKEKHKEKKHSKSKKMLSHAPGKGSSAAKCCHPPQASVGTPFAVNVPPPSIFHVEGQSEKKKKKEEKDKEKVEKPEKMLPINQLLMVQASFMLDCLMLLLGLSRRRTALKAEQERQRRWHIRLSRSSRNYPRPRIYKPRTTFEDLSEELCFMRMRFGKEAIGKLCDLLSDDLQTCSRTSTALSVSMKVTTTLNFLASGSFLACTGDISNISKEAARNCIHQVVDAIVRKADYFIQLDLSEQACRERSLQFHSIAGFPKVIGAVDGTHVALRVIGKNTVNYINRKGFKSLNVMLICDARLRILCVSTASRGSNHDSTVLRNSTAYERIRALPEGSGWLLGDKGYPLRPWLLTPFRRTSTASQERYNRSHASTRQVVERTIGVLKSRFRCIDRSGRTLMYSHYRTGKMVQACCCLHNFAIAEGVTLDPDAYLPAEDDISGDFNRDQPGQFDDEPNAAHCRAAREGLVNSTFRR